MLTQADDFLAESEALHTLIAPLDGRALTQVTQFKGWTIEDVILHLHFWNGAADLAAQNPKTFRTLITQMMAALKSGALRTFEDAQIEQRGTDLRDAWIARVREMAPRWQAMDPRARLAWVGPDMSARSSMTARQMETWAHGYEVWDVLGHERAENDRVKNIVILGLNTFGWSHQVHGLPVPPTRPALELTAPSGAVWSYAAQGGEDAGAITGPAVDFAAVVTQTRALADTALRSEGPVARTWMENAQCFAGPPERPPAPGSRARSLAPGPVDG